MTVATSTPNADASAQPMEASPRIRTRTRHSNSVANSPVRNQATRMEEGGELAVEGTGQRQDRHADDRREQAEVGVRVSAVDESFDAQRSVGQPQVPVEHGPGLEVVEVVLIVGRSQRVDRSPRRPEHPDERDGDHRQPDHAGDGEPSARPAPSDRGPSPSAVAASSVGARPGGRRRRRRGPDRSSTATTPDEPTDRSPISGECSQAGSIPGIVPSGRRPPVAAGGDRVTCR